MPLVATEGEFGTPPQGANVANLGRVQQNWPQNIILKEPESRSSQSVPQGWQHNQENIYLVSRTDHSERVLQLDGELEPSLTHPEQYSARSHPSIHVPERQATITSSRAAEQVSFSQPQESSMAEPSPRSEAQEIPDPEVPRFAALEKRIGTERSSIEHLLGQLRRQKSQRPLAAHKPRRRRSAKQSKFLAGVSGGNPYLDEGAGYFNQSGLEAQPRRTHSRSSSVSSGSSGQHALRQELGRMGVRQLHAVELKLVQAMHRNSSMEKHVQSLGRQVKHLSRVQQSIDPRLNSSGSPSKLGSVEKEARKWKTRLGESRDQVEKLREQRGHILSANMKKVQRKKDTERRAMQQKLIRETILKRLGGNTQQTNADAVPRWPSAAK